VQNPKAFAGMVVFARLARHERHFADVQERSSNSIFNYLSTVYPFNGIVSG
jgi:hypothetical protein